jgi:hypothetical protein
VNENLSAFFLQLRAASRSLFGQELELDDATFELDYQLRLPLSLPGMPLELETDIVMGLEKLRLGGEGDLDIEISPVEQIQDVPLTRDLMPQNLVNRLYTPTISSSFNP